MADETNTGAMSGMGVPTLEDWQHWTLVMGRAQQMLMEFWAASLKKDQPFPAWSPPAFGFGEAQGASDPMALMSAGAQAWAKGLESWGKMLGQAREGGTAFFYWMAIFPGLAIFLTVFSYNLIGEAVRDALDPKLHTT